jgi:hypothetical protein
MTTSADDFRTLRRQNRLAAERIRSARLLRAERLAQRQLTESISLDWVQPYAEMLDRYRWNGDPVFSGPAQYWNRQYGRDWPIYQTEQELALFRAPARILLATNDDAIGLVNGLRSYIVGTGFTYRWAPNKGSKFPPEAVQALQWVTD